MELRYPEQLRRSESTVARQGRSEVLICEGVAKNRYDPQRQSNGRADTQRHSGPEQRQSAAMIRNGGKEPIGKGKASTGFTRQRRNKAAMRNGKPVRFLAMASQRLQGWARAMQRIELRRLSESLVSDDEARLATRRQ